VAESYAGGVPAGTEGHEAMAARVTTDVLACPEGIDPPDRAHVNELLAYLGWNHWDALGETPPGDPGHRAVGALQAWQRYPELLGALVEQAGPDGVAALGASARRGLGGKAGPGHLWSLATAFGLGRGLAVATGRADGQQREDELRAVLGLVRGLYGGLRGPGAPLFASADGYRAAVLEPDWLDWLRGTLGPVGELGKLHDAASRLADLVHFDHPGARQDHGPYPDDAGVLLVRELYLAEPAYHWADVTDGLPFSLVLALRLPAGTPLEITDAGRVRGALPEPEAAAVFARPLWDTPGEQLRMLDPEQGGELAGHCAAVADRLAARVAAMPRRDRAMAGAQVFYLEPVIGLARRAGVWDALRTDLDCHELDPLVSEAYYELVPGGAAADLLPRLTASGTGFPAVKDPISAEAAMPALHLLALREVSAELPVPADELESAGLIAAGPDGYRLTDAGRGTHQRQLEAERRGYETERMAQAYERFVALDEPMHAVLDRWDAADQGQRGELLGELTDIVQRARVALRRTNEQLVRFEPYLPRLRRALTAAKEGAPEYVTGTDVDSVAVVWSELHRDYRLTQGLD
jgi:hypothetical protein